MKARKQRLAQNAVCRGDVSTLSQLMYCVMNETNQSSGVIAAFGSVTDHFDKIDSELRIKIAFISYYDCV